MFSPRKNPDSITFAGYQAFNCAVTAWHLADCAWAYADEKRKGKIATHFKFRLKGKPRENLNLFYEALCRDSRDLHICRHIANSSKHLKVDKADGGFQAEIGQVKFRQAQMANWSESLACLLLIAGRLFFWTGFLGARKNIGTICLPNLAISKPPPKNELELCNVEIGLEFQTSTEASVRIQSVSV